MDNKMYYTYIVNKYYASLAQLDRALVYGTKGQEFESLMTHQLLYMPLFRDSLSYGVLLCEGVFLFDNNTKNC